MRTCLWMKVLILRITILFSSANIVQATVEENFLTDEISVYHDLLSNETLIDDTLDQENSDWRGEEYSNENGCMAQSF